MNNQTIDVIEKRDIDRIYLLSSPEIGDTGPDTASSKTRLLDYYKGKNNNSRIKGSYLWLRNAWSSFDYIYKLVWWLV